MLLIYWRLEMLPSYLDMTDMNDLGFGDKSEAIKFGEKENTTSDTRLNFSGMQ